MHHDYHEIATQHVIGEQPKQIFYRNIFCPKPKLFGIAVSVVVFCTETAKNGRKAEIPKNYSIGHCTTLCAQDRKHFPYIECFLSTWESAIAVQHVMMCAEQKLKGSRYFMGQRFCVLCFEICTPSLFSLHAYRVQIKKNHAQKP